jgi:hypothetical protein
VVVTAAISDALSVVGALLGGAVAGLIPALLVLWASGRLERPGPRAVSAPPPPRPPARAAAAGPVPEAGLAAAALPDSLAFTPTRSAPEPAPATAPGVPVPPLEPAVAQEVPAGEGDQPEAGRHRELYDHAYAGQLHRLDALRAEFRTELTAAARAARRFERGERPLPDPEDA